MNILMISLDFPPTVGGISAHVYELSKALGRLGSRVSVVTRRLAGQRERERVGDIDIFRLKLRWMAPLYGWQLNRFVQRQLSEINPDVIHIHGMAPLEGYRVRDIPLVYTNHTSGYLKRIQKGGLRRMALLKRLFKKPRLFIAPSRELLEIPFPVTARKLFIPNGVDAEKYRRSEEDRRRLRSELGLAPDDIVGILTRRLVAKNGVVYLAKACSMIQNQRLKLLIIGDGPEYEAVKRQLDQHFKGRFFMLGAKTHDEIIPYYSAADLSILPSLMEATSISGLEAMSASLPLVGTRVGGIPDLIEDGINGYLCKPADEKDLAQKIDRLLAGDLRLFGQKSRRLVREKFAWAQIAIQTRSAYESLL